MSVCTHHSFVCLQDIAVDGWALTLLPAEHMSYASTCQTLGQTTGIFTSFTVFLALQVWVRLWALPNISPSECFLPRASWIVQAACILSAGWAAGRPRVGVGGGGHHTVLGSKRLRWLCKALPMYVQHVSAFYVSSLQTSSGVCGHMLMPACSPGCRMPTSATSTYVVAAGSCQSEAGNSSDWLLCIVSAALGLRHCHASAHRGWHPHPMTHALPDQAKRMQA